jgi:hypothetical protein
MCKTKENCSCSCKNGVKEAKTKVIVNKLKEKLEKLTGKHIILK